MSPHKAFILAAGYGTRLLPLTRVVPKPLLPMCGKLMLDRALQMVKSWGVCDVTVNVHHGAHDMVHHLVHRKPDGLRIQLSYEADILGTGGALKKASWFFSDQQPFWMVNADVVADVDVQPILATFKRGSTIASAWVMSSRGPRTVECEKGFITNFQSKRPGTNGTFTFCGVHLVDPAILNFLPDAGFASIIQAYQMAMADGWKIAGVPVEESYWADIGTPGQYINAAAEYSKYKNRRTQRELVAPLTSVRISKDRRLILGPGVAEKKYTGVMALRASDALDEFELALTSKWEKSLDKIIACPLAPRGSARTFTRLYAGNKTAILVRHKPDREENNLYTGHTRFLKAMGLPVPYVIGENKEMQMALFEDSGERCVQDEAATWSPEKLEKLYRGVLDAMMVFHEEGYRLARSKKLKLMPPFDQKLFSWEHDLFTGLFLRDRLGIKEKAITAIDHELKRLSKKLLKLRRVLVHRDLQSSNIQLKNNQWSLIDYQGMRFGPAVYDLSSLLCDPYIRIDQDVRIRLMEHYSRQADKHSMCADMFWPGAVQRLGQALGAYARLGKLTGTERFVRYIPPALENLREALGHMDNVPVLSETIHAAINKISK